MKVSVTSYTPPLRVTQQRPFAERCSSSRTASSEIVGSVVWHTRQSASRRSIGARTHVCCPAGRLRITRSKQTTGALPAGACVALRKLLAFCALGNMHCGWYSLRRGASRQRLRWRSTCALASQQRSGRPHTLRVLSTRSSSSTAQRGRFMAQGRNQITSEGDV